MDVTSFIQLNKPGDNDFITDDKLWKENPDKIDAKFIEHSNRLSSVESGLSQKASQTDLNTTNANVTANAASLAQKATQADLNSVATYKEINGANPIGTTLSSLKGDGTDETSKLLALLNYVGDNHLTLYIPKNITVYVDSLTVLNKSNFGIRCEGTIKRLNNSPTVGTLIKLDTCSNVSIYELNMDGNGLNNGCVEGTAYTNNQEQKHSLILSACTNVNIDKFYVLNPCGDGIYITGNSQNISMQSVKGHADQKIGRNLVSIINAQDIFIDYFYSDGIGHYDMPGAFDIEPNLNTDVVRNVFVNSMSIRSAGTNLLSILQTNSGTVENIFIGRAKVTYQGTSNNSQCVLISAADVQIGELKIDGGGYANLINIDSTSTTCKNVFIRKASGKNGYRGIMLGFTGQVLNIEINVVFTNLSLDGVALYWVKGAKLNIDIDSVGASRFMVNSSPSTGTVENIYLTGNISKRGTGTYAILSNATATKNLNWVLENLDFTGWGNDTRLNGAGLQTSIIKRNCPNLTLLSAKPNFEQWRIGDVVYNTAPAETGTTGSMYIVEKWIAVANGQGASIWRDSRVLTGN